MTDGVIQTDDLRDTRAAVAGPTTEQQEAVEPPQKDATRKHIRGSSLLLVGRVIAMALNFGVQVLTVRYLAKNDYGAFAYALSVISMSASAVLFGLDKAIARFVPIYQERGDHNRMVGTVVLAFGTVLALGALLVAAAFTMRGLLAERVVSDPLSATLLLSIIFLAPVQALDSVFEGLFAVFVKPSAIFFRRHLLGPGLKLSVVALAVLLRADVHFIAYGYLIGALLGVGMYVVMLVQVLRKEAWFRNLTLRGIIVPVREVFSFSVPLLTTDILIIARSNMVVVLLEALRGTTAVANFKAVLPFAGLNLVVYQSFKYLYTPLAARFYQRKDTKHINELYWQTAVWIAVISFPVLAVTVALAEPLTVLTIGSRYAQSAVILAIVSVGEYFNAAFGYNSYTLQVYGKVRYIVFIDVITAVTSLALNYVLIQQFGPLGAAIGTAGTLVLYNVLNHVGLYRIGIDLFRWRYLRMYLSIVAMILLLVAVQWLLSPPLIVSIIATVLVCLALLMMNRNLLEVERFFPEIKRVPVLGRLVA